MMSDLLPSMKSVTGELAKGNNVWISLVIEDKQKFGRVLCSFIA
ncbi:hypothetical protein [Cohnella sp. CFH 77786]